VKASGVESQQAEEALAELVDVWLARAAEALARMMEVWPARAAEALAGPRETDEAKR